MSRYLYYPGCSMDGSGRAYGESLTAVCEKLGLTLAEIDDWNCCGATEYVGVSLSPAYALIARNLAIAAEVQAGQRAAGRRLQRLLPEPRQGRRLHEGAAPLNDHVNEALDAGGLHYDPGSVEIRHLLEVIMNDVGLDAVRAKVVKPLAGLRVAPYLGCMLPRPDPDHRWKNHERPDDLDRLLAALGADVVDFPLKTECCGGHMTQIAPKVGLELIKRLVDEAEHHLADMMVTVCPMCQINIDAYQGEMNALFHTKHKMPIVFFTQLMGVAFGLDPKKMGIGRELTDARPALKKIGKQPGPAVAAESGAGPQAKTGQARPADAAHGRRSDAVRRGSTASSGHGHAYSSDARPDLPRRGRDPDRRLRLPLRQQHRRHGGRRRSRPLGGRELCKDQGVVVAREYKFMCSSPGQELITDDIRDLGLNRIVVAACSPHLHEKTFRTATARAGLNPYLCELVSIREQDSWVHTDKAAATAKAKAILAGGVERVRRNEPLDPHQRRHQPGHAGRGRRHRRHPGHARDRGRRLPRLSRGEGRLDRRPHGPVRQDLPHPGLRGLHPDSAHGLGRHASQRHAPDLERGHARRRLRRQLHGQRSARRPAT